MNLFETVKSAVTMKQAAEHYGCKVNRVDMIRCPFHVVAASCISFASAQARKLIHSAAAPLPSMKLNKKKLTWWQDEFWKHMVKKFSDLERGEGASLTGRDYDSAIAILKQIPPEVLELYKHSQKKERETAYDR